MHHPSTSISHLLTDLSVLIDSLGWIRSIAHRQQSQPWQPVKCGPSMEPVSTRIKRFRDEWISALRAIAEACPAAADQCSVLLKLDPLRPDSEAAITEAVARIRHLSDPLTVRTMARQRERSAFGEELRRLRLARGLSLRGLASECKQAAKRLRFHSHTPLPYQIVRYEAGRLAPHPRTARVIPAALGVSVSVLESAPA